MATIKESLEILKKAQEIDREIYEAGAALRVQIPEERVKIRRRLDIEKTHLKELEETFKTLQLRQKQKESLLADKEANIKKLNGQLAQVKTNKEYSAFQQEIASLKADNSLLEEEVIKILDEVEAAEEEVNREKERLKKIEKDLSAVENELLQKEQKLSKDQELLEKSREEILHQIPDDLRGRYNLIISKKQGLALVKVKGENCGACQLLLRPQILNEVRLAQSVILCENCARILYYEEASI